MTGAGAAPPVVPAPRAPAGSADATRRFAVRGAARDLFPGLTRPEAEAVAQQLAGRPAHEWEGALVEIQLPVVLSDAAGPHLLDADGRITLPLGPHPRVAGARVAMGQPFGRRALHAVGLVRRSDAARLWRWTVRAEVPSAERVTALDELAAGEDDTALARWQARWSAGGAGR